MVHLLPTLRVVHIRLLDAGFVHSSDVINAGLTSLKWNISNANQYPYDRKNKKHPVQSPLIIHRRFMTDLCPERNHNARE